MSDEFVMIVDERMYDCIRRSVIIAWCWFSSKINECIWSEAINVERQRTKRKVICNSLCFAATTSITKRIFFISMRICWFFFLSLNSQLGLFVKIGSDISCISLVSSWERNKWCSFNYHSSFCIICIIKLEFVYREILCARSLHCHCFGFAFDSICFSLCTILQLDNYRWNETTILNYGTRFSFSVFFLFSFISVPKYEIAKKKRLHTINHLCYLYEYCWYKKLQ